MNKIEMLIQTYNVLSSISGYDYTLDDIFIISNPKLEGYSNGLLFEILYLLDKGYKEEDIIELIDKCQFENDLNNYEKDCLRKNAKKTLKKIINNKKGEIKYE